MNERLIRIFYILQTVLVVLLFVAGFNFFNAVMAPAADFGMFGGSGGAGGSFPLAEGGAGSSLTAIGGAGGYANNLSGGGGGGQGGYYDGDSNMVTGGANGLETNHSFNGGDGGGGAAAGTGGNGTSGNDATALYGGGGGGSYGDFVTGGNGGDGSTTGGGGGGGGFGQGPNNSSGGSAYVLELNMSYTGYDSVMIEGGHGGNGGLSNNNYAGGGGDGAGAKANAAALLTVKGNLAILAGSGGNGGNDYGDFTNGFAGDGGDGGGAELDASGKIVEVNGILSVTSGLNGTNGTSSSAGQGGSGGLGGDAVFTADTLSAPAINLTQNDGALTFTVTTLNVSAANTTLNLDGTTAAGVAIGALAFGNSRTLTVTSANGGGMTASGDIDITGTGVYNSPITWDAQGHALNFDLNGVTAANDATDVSLKTTGSAGILIDASTSLNVTNHNGLAALDLGGTYTLIQSTTGTFTSQNLTDVSDSSGTHSFVVNTDTGSLYVFKNKFATTGDYTLTGPVSYTAGAGTNESILLDVTGTLTVNGGGLTLSDNGSNSATVNAGTLVTSELSLVGANTRASIGILDVTVQDVVLNLDGTTAAGVTIGELAFGNGRTLTVTSANSGGMTASGDIDITGTGVYNSPITWDAQGHALNFDLNGVTAANNATDVSLKTSGSAGILIDASTSLNVTNHNGLAALDLGGTYTLIQSTTGTFTSQNLTDVTSVSGTHGFVANADAGSLYVFKNKFATTGDYTLTGPVSYTASAGTNESILLDVTGTLTVSGGGLTLSDNSSNSATVNAGTLVTPELSLVGANTRANIGILDVTVQDVVLNLDGTTAAGVTIGELAFGNGRTLTVTSANSGGMTASGDITIIGYGNVYNSALPFDATGQMLYFELPTALQLGTPLLAAPNAAINVSNATLTLSEQGQLTSLKHQDLIVLIDNVTGTIQDENTIIKTLFFNYDFLVSTTASGHVGQLTATFQNLDQSEVSHVFSEAYLSKTIMINSGADLLAGDFLNQAMDYGKQRYGFTPIVSISGHSIRYKTGSHVDVDGVSYLAGLAWSDHLRGGNFTLGVFFEGGHGTYDTYNSFANMASIKGKGDVDYYGGGVLGRVEMVHGLYVEGSARAGKVESDFQSSRLSSLFSQDVKYDSDTAYYGGHVGVGYMGEIIQGFKLGIASKYLWTHQESDSMDIAGMPVKFDAIDSHRWRNEASLYYEVTPSITTYTSAAFEYEFAGKARAKAAGVALDAPELRGGSGLGQLGLIYSDPESSGFYINASIQGFVGKREGVAGNLSVGFSF